MNIGLLADKTLSGFRLKTLEPILNDDTFTISIAAIDYRIKLNRWETFKKNIRRGRGGYTVIMALKKMLGKSEKSVDAADFFKNKGIKIITAADLYSDKVLDEFRKSKLDVLLLIGGFGILKEPVLNVARFGVLSYHHGNMRMYRGMPFGFWELYYGEKEMGLTVQKLSPGIDTGIPVTEKSLNIEKICSLATLQKMALEESEMMLYETLNVLKSRDYEPIEIEQYGNLYTQPNFREWFVLQVKMLIKKISLILTNGK